TGARSKPSSSISSMHVKRNPDRRVEDRTEFPVEVPKVRAFIRHRLDVLARRLVRDRDLPIDGAVMGEVRFLRDLDWAPRKRLVVPVLFATTAVCMTALVFLRLPSIRIDADVLCSALTFRVASPIQLTGLNPMSLLQATEYRAA